MTEDEKKKIIIKKPASPSPAKKTTIKKVPTKTNADKPEEADNPTEIETAGWKKALAEKKEALQPKVLRSKSELWDHQKEERAGKKRYRGFIVLVDGLGKVGKTNMALSAVNFEGLEGKRRIIPAGHPVFVLDTENATEDEADFHFSDEFDKGSIIIKNCFVEDPITRLIDPVKSLDTLEEWALSLTSETKGTLIIDNFTDYCEWVYYKLVDVVLGKNYGFNEHGEEKKKIAPVQYKWRNKHIKSFLRRLRNIPINVVLICQVKDEYDNSGSAFESKKTGRKLTDAIEGIEYWVDIIARYEKETDPETDKVIRKLIISDSRFETENMEGREYTLEGNPTFQGIVDLIKDLL